MWKLFKIITIGDKMQNLQKKETTMCPMVQYNQQQQKKYPAMSKVILEFNMPEEEREANFALKGESYAYVLKNLDQKLRDITKYKNNPFYGGKATEEQIQLAEQIREYLREQNIDELWR